MASYARSVHPSLACVGYHVHRQVVSRDLITAAVRRLNLAIVRRGLTADEIAEGMRGTFFPHLRWDPEIFAIQQEVDGVVLRENTGEWADPQLLLRFPGEATEWQPWPHLDEPPPWANGRRYRIIAGVALSPSRLDDGCLTVWPTSHVAERTCESRVELDPGDVVVMHPKLWHGSTLNRGPWIRDAAYFRLLAAPPPREASSGLHEEVDTHPASSDLAMSSGQRRRTERGAVR